MDDADRELIVKIRFALIKGDMEYAKKATEDLAKRIKDGVGKSTEDVQRKFTQMRESAKRLQQIGIITSAVGAAIAGPFVLAAKNYVQTAGVAEATSRQWLASTHQLEIAYTRIGRVAAQEALPALRSAAQIAQNIASIIEQNPWIAQAALTIGGTLTAVGATVTVAAQGVRMVSNVGSLLSKAGGALGLGGGAAGVGSTLLGGGALATGTAVAGSVLSGAAIGLIVNEVLARLAPQTGAATFGKWATAGMYGFGRVLDIATGQETDVKSQKAALAVAYLTGEIDELTAKAGLAAIKQQELANAENTVAGVRRQDTGGGNQIDLQAVNAYVQYQRQIVELDRNTARERSSIATQYNTQVLQTWRNFYMQIAEMTQSYLLQQARASADYQKQVSRQSRDFQQSELRSEQAYYRQRMIQARDYNIETQRMEEDHQRSLKRAQQQHQLTLDRLISQGDVLGIVQEQRNYEYQRQQAEEDYQIQASRRNEDYARQLKDQEDQYRLERQQRLEDYRLRLADQAADEAERRKRAQEDYERQIELLKARTQAELEQLELQKTQSLAKLQEIYDAEKVKLTDAFAEQLEAMGAWSSKFSDKFYSAMEDRYKTFVKGLDSYIPDWMKKAMGKTTSSSNDAGAGIPKRAEGGYTRGLTWTGERGEEFILSNQVTRMAERITGSRLTQENMLAMMSGNVHATINQDFRFQGVLSAAEKEQYRLMARQETKQGILEAFPA